MKENLTEVSKMSISHFSYFNFSVWCHNSNLLVYSLCSCRVFSWSVSLLCLFASRWAVIAALLLFRSALQGVIRHLCQTPSASPCERRRVMPAFPSPSFIIFPPRYVLHSLRQRWLTCVNHYLHKNPQAISCLKKWMKNTKNLRCTKKNQSKPSVLQSTIFELISSH